MNGLDEEEGWEFLPHLASRLKVRKRVVMNGIDAYGTRINETSSTQTALPCDWTKLA